MKIPGRIRPFSFACLAAACLTPWLFSSCSSLSADDLAPAAAARPTQPDGYPNLNLPVTAAAPQLTAEERERLTQELSSVRGGGASGGTSPAEAERLRRLARQHAEERLRAIETSQ